MRGEKTKDSNTMLQRQEKAISNGQLSGADIDLIESRSSLAKIQNQKRQKERAAVKAKEERKKSRMFSWGELAVIFTALCCFLFFLAAIVFYESWTTETLKRMKNLQLEYAQLLSENDALESDIMTGINVEEILNIATHTLHMSYPKKSQVIEYQRKEREYIKHGEEIPQ